MTVWRRHPVGRNLVGLAAAHLDEITLHAVVAETQVLEAGTFALADLEVEQRLVAVLADATQFVEVRIEACCKHATFTEQGGRCLDECLGQVRMDGGVHSSGFRQPLQQGRIQCCQQCLQGRQAAERLAQL